MTVVLFNTLLAATKFQPDGADDVDGDHTRGAVLVEVEAEEVCTAAPLMAVSPRHTPQKPVYTYGQAEARLLCETSSAVTGTAVLQPNGSGENTRVSILSLPMINLLVP